MSNETRVQGTTKSSRYADAVNKATGQELTVTGKDAGFDVAVLEAVPPGFGSIAKPFTPDEAAIAMAKADLEWAPRVIQLVEGMMLEGILEGRGEDVELDEVDPILKKVTTKIVSSWVIRDPKSGLRASFLTAAQLETKLPPFVGDFVKIFVGGMKESKKGHRYRDYLVGGARRTDGQPRVFTRPLLVESTSAAYANANPVATAADLTE